MVALINRGASVNVQLKTGDTLLHLALANKDMNGKLPTCSAEHGAWSCLATGLNHYNAQLRLTAWTLGLELLLKHGAWVDEPGSQSLTVTELAQKARLFEVVTLVGQYSGNVKPDVGKQEQDEFADTTVH